MRRITRLLAANRLRRFLAASAHPRVGLVAVFALGCSTAVPTAPDVSLDGKVWAKANDAYAAPGDYEKAVAACRGPGGGELPEVAAAPEVASGFVRCMADEGWILVDAP